MANISLLIADNLAEGTVSYTFISDAPLPNDVKDLTPAQTFSIELKKYLDELTG